MDLAKTVFEAIDIIFDKAQNDCPFLEHEDQIEIEKNIIYDETTPSVCKLDTYVLPQAAGKYPVLFYIHGGGFVAGGKQYRTALAKWYAEHGIFVVNVDYGLSPEYHFPVPLRHLLTALNWVQDNAERLRLDLDHLFVSGDSAGGYFSALLAVVAGNEALQRKINCFTNVKIKAAVLNCGLYDIEKVMSTKMIFDLNEKVFQDYTGVDVHDFNTYEYKELCSPVSLVDATFPPTLLIFAKKDIFCGGQAEQLIKVLEEQRVYYEKYYSKTLLRNHCFSLEWVSKEAKEANAMILDFINRFVQNELPKPRREKHHVAA